MPSPRRRGWFTPCICPVIRPSHRPSARNRCWLSKPSRRARRSIRAGSRTPSGTSARDACREFNTRPCRRRPKHRMPVPTRRRPWLRSVVAVSRWYLARLTPAAAVDNRRVGIELLGPLRVDGDSGSLQRRDQVVLSALAVDAGEVLSADQLAAASWGEPHRLVAETGSRQRVAVTPDVRRGAIETTPSGYRLTVPADGLDTHRFEELIVHGRSLAAGGECDRAAVTFGRALALCGRLEFDVVDGWSPGRIEAARLDELRLSAEERLFDARLAAGEHRDVVAHAEVRCPNSRCGSIVGRSWPPPCIGAAGRPMPCGRSNGRAAPWSMNSVSSRASSCPRSSGRFSAETSRWRLSRRPCRRSRCIARIRGSSRMTSPTPRRSSGVTAEIRRLPASARRRARCWSSPGPRGAVSRHSCVPG